jgi:phosphoserine phosphatase
MLVVGVLVTAALVLPTLRAEARHNGPKLVRAQARSAKQLYGVYKAQVRSWPHLPKGSPGAVLPHRTKEAKKTKTKYKTIPKQIRRRLEPRIKSIVKQIARTGRSGAAVVDWDGTACAGDVGEGFFTWMLSNGHYPKNKLPMLRKAWRGYKAGTFDGEKMYELMVTSMAGMKEKDVYNLAHLYFDGTHRHRIYRPTADLVKALQRIGIEPWVVSGSPFWVVVAGARHLGIPPERVIGLRVKTKNGTLTGEVDRPVPWKMGKAKRIQRHLKTTPILAVGNSVGDIQMLKTASEISLVVNPGPRTLHHATQLGWTIHRYNREDELARSVRGLPAPPKPAGLLPAPTTTPQSR